MAHRSTWGLEGCVSKGVSGEQPAAEGTGHSAVVPSCARWTSIREPSATWWPRPSVSHQVETLARRDSSVLA